jgi:hypothetical protein
MKFTLIASLVAGAAAFAPSSKIAKSSTALNESPYSNELGVIA